jgi:hypothetical protein
MVMTQAASVNVFARYCCDTRLALPATYPKIVLYNHRQSSGKILDKTIGETAMKTAIFLISIMIIGQTAMAMEDGKKQEMFEKGKEVKVQGIKDRISIDQGELSCVQAAKNHDDVKSCADKAKAANEDLMRKQKERWEALKK